MNAKQIYGGPWDGGLVPPEWKQKVIFAHIEHSTRLAIYHRTYGFGKDVPEGCYRFERTISEAEYADYCRQMGHV